MLQYYGKCSPHASPTRLIQPSGLLVDQDAAYEQKCGSTHAQNLSSFAMLAARCCDLKHLAPTDATTARGTFVNVDLSTLISSSGCEGK